MTDRLFMDPKVNQYGSHLVMSNVMKPTKRRYINIDTRFRDNYSMYEAATVENYQLTLPERVNDVKSMIVCGVELPMSFYNISANLENNAMIITIGSTKQTIVVPDSNYTPTTIISTLNTLFGALPAPFNSLNASIVNNKTTIAYSGSGNMTVDLDAKSDGSYDKYNFKKKLGWLLGFRAPTYANTKTITAENFADLNGLRYVYLAVDEYGKGNQNSFMGAMPTSTVNKNIIAKIIFNKSTFPFGSILPANTFNGYLLTDRRTYAGKIDIQKLNIQLVDEIGNPINLNGLDFSFCLEVEYE